MKRIGPRRGCASTILLDLWRSATKNIITVNKLNSIVVHTRHSGGFNAIDFPELGNLSISGNCSISHKSNLLQIFARCVENGIRVASVDLFSEIRYLPSKSGAHTITCRNGRELPLLPRENIHCINGVWYIHNCLVIRISDGFCALGPPKKENKRIRWLMEA